MIRILWRGIVWFVTLVAVIVFGWTLAHALFIAPDGEIAAPWLAQHAPAAHAPSTALPDRLIIPSLNINAAVQQTGIKADGSMGTPSNFTDVAWYKYGIIPGQIGSAVIDGHVDNGLALAGVFKHLGDIKVGDDVYVQQKDGNKIHFQVVEIEIYSYKDAPVQKIFAQYDAAWLNLITCKGTWVKDDKTYDERLVVYTKLVP